MSRIGLLKHGLIHIIELNAQHQDIFLINVASSYISHKIIAIYIYYIG